MPEEAVEALLAERFGPPPHRYHKGMPLVEESVESRRERLLAESLAYEKAQRDK